jgi:hypothetical protein
MHYQTGKPFFSDVQFIMTIQIEGKAYDSNVVALKMKKPDEKK